MGFLGFAPSDVRAVASLGGSLGSSFASAFGNSIQSSLTSSAARTAVYVSNRLGPTMVPSIDQLLQLWWTGRADAEDFRSGLNSQAVSHDPDRPSNNRWPSLWADLIELGKPAWDIGTYRRWFRMGRITRQQFDDQLKRAGFVGEGGAFHQKQENARNASLFASEFDIPDVTLCIELWRRGVIDKDELHWYLRSMGYTRSDERQRFSALVQPVNLGEALVMRNRGLIRDGELVDYIDRLGFAAGDDSRKLAELRHEIPGASDLVRFAVREAFAPSIAKRLGFWDEFPPAIGEWMDKQGYGKPFTVTDPQTGEQAEMTWALANWVSHWQLPSPTQAYGFLHRLRSTGGPNGGPRDPSGLEFTSRNLSDLLKTADYPAPFRKLLEATSYRVLDKRDVRWAVQFLGWDAAEATEAYQDQGYNVRDAERLAAIDKARFGGKDTLSVDAFRRQTLSKLIACQLDLYTAGGIAREEATANLTAMQIPELDATRRLDVIDICWRTSQLKLAVKSIKRAFLRGELDASTARMRLVQSGVTPRYIDAYLQRWNLEFTPRRRELSTEKVLDALARSYINLPEAIARLGRLGWTQPDQLVLVADAQRVFAERQAKAAAGQERTRRAQAKDLERLADEAEKQVKKFRAELNRIEPMAMLKRLAAKGEITREQYEQALTVRGLPPSSIWRTLADTYGLEPKPVPPGGVQRANGEAEKIPAQT